MNPENQTPTAEGVKKVVNVGKIEVSRVYTANFQKENTLTAELKQTISTKTTYPARTVTSNLQDNPFGNEEFSFGEGQSFDSSETRVAWINVPMGSTVESVLAQLAKMPEARLYKILSNRPIVSDIQEAAIKQELTSEDIIGDAQAVRFPKNHETKAGQLILVDGKPQYRAVFFTKLGTADLDRRTKVADDFYATAKVKQEMSIASDVPAVESQTVL